MFDPYQYLDEPLSEDRAQTFNTEHGVEGRTLNTDQITTAIDEFECEQISYDELLFVLSRLPISSVRLDPPCSLYLIFCDMLDEEQAVLFAGLHPDECDIDGDEVYLWWA